MHHHKHLIHILSFLPISNSGLNLAAHFKFQIGITVKYASPAFLLSLHSLSDSDFPLSAFHIFSLLSLYSDKISASGEIEDWASSSSVIGIRYASPPLSPRSRGKNALQREILAVVLLSNAQIACNALARLLACLFTDYLSTLHIPNPSVAFGANLR